MGYRVCGCKAARTERRLFGCFPEITFACFHFALLAGVGVVHIHLGPKPGWLHLQAPAHIFANFLYN